MWGSGEEVIKFTHTVDSASGAPRKVSKRHPFEGIIPNMVRRFRETDSVVVREELSPESRKFLVKQGHDSVVVGLDLIGMDDELAVLSGRAETTGVAREVIAELGNDPKLWLPEFHRRRRPS